MFLTHGLGMAAYLGHPIGRCVKLLSKSEEWSRQQIETHQGEALNALMRHCYEHVPYYRNVMKARSLTPDDFNSPCDLAKLPYLTKEIIREYSETLRADNYPDNQCLFRRTGGTTGEPIKVAIDVRARAFEIASYLRGFQWMKYRLGNPRVVLFGGSLGFEEDTRLKVRLREWILNSRFLSAFELTPDNVARYVTVMNEGKQGVLVGYASAAFHLAEYMEMRGFKGCPLRSVICTAEYMPDEWRTRIQEVMEVPVFCYYGCGEIQRVAHESDGEEGYVVSQEHIILEVANGYPEAFRNEGRGETCLTTLFNYAMPLIRYLNGDICELQYANRGHAHLRITRLEGRVMDQLLKTDGTKISSVLPTHFVYRSGIPVWKYQTVQTGVDNIVFHYVLREGEMLSDEMKNTLERVFRKYLGESLRIEFVVGEFEVTKSGKHRFVINRALERLQDRDVGFMSS
jgi:phenylacetate-CoA ligase